MKEIYESDFIECIPVTLNHKDHIVTRFDKIKKKVITFKTKKKEYLQMEKDCKKQLKSFYLDEKKSYRIEYEFFLGKQGSDVDNFIKCFQDILQDVLRKKNEKFDDNLFYEIQAKKYFPETNKGAKTGVKFKIFEIKIEKEKYGMSLKINKKLGVECYESN